MKRRSKQKHSQLLLTECVKTYDLFFLGGRTKRTQDTRRGDQNWFRGIGSASPFSVYSDNFEFLHVRRSDTILLITCVNHEGWRWGSWLPYGDEYGISNVVDTSWHLIKSVTHNINASVKCLKSWEWRQRVVLVSRWHKSPYRGCHSEIPCVYDPNNNNSFSHLGDTLFLLRRNNRRRKS